jgi:hypothetical protein
VSPNAGFDEKKSCGHRQRASASPSCGTLDYKHTWRRYSKAHAVWRPLNHTWLSLLTRFWRWWKKEAEISPLISWHLWHTHNPTIFPRSTHNVITRRTFLVAMSM